VKARISFVSLLALFSGPILQLRAAEDVDLLLFNGNVYTVNEKTPRAETIAVRKDRVVFVGSNEDARRFHAARTVDLHGHTVVPGLTDSHCHIFGIGERELRLNLEGANTLEDFLGKVKARVTKTKRGQWITAAIPNATRPRQNCAAQSRFSHPRRRPRRNCELGRAQDRQDRQNDAESVRR